MALHGELLVNAVPIGGWYARRTIPLCEGDDQHYVYECEAVRYADGYKVSFTMNHDFTLGAFVLAGKVTMKAGLEFHAKPVTEQSAQMIFEEFFWDKK